ncbi:D-glycero-alpha-D-manno-heptose-1,7-bisphosphate 7-phosphatase [Alteromonas oceanisediminis]|uniref:D-glycero-alpha-D-manno-heptose-1,7-bisphosphate 7-phosphatase n=1 Tax=Alteromonas oceanisediminis TaxID=2836180 RepID=UPI001BDB24AA|nr:HAD family hydrolase [Alteromonas oceanisediminis]MBT0587200.1 HAD family hydrolase [Alteromonas oceanisediminis]
MEKALFLDRDGIINVNHGYVYKIDDIDFVEGIFHLIKRFVAAGYQPVIVTNQSGIARGFYSVDEFHAAMAYIQRVFTDNGLPQIPVYFCPHHPDYGADNERNCACRKPQPGMLLKAQQDLNLDLTSSVLLGDKSSDIAAARAANLNRAILFDPGSDEINKLTPQQLTHHRTQVECVHAMQDINP